MVMSKSFSFSFSSSSSMLFLPLILFTFLCEYELSNGIRLTPRIDLSLLKMAAEETIATVQEDGYVGILLNVARDVAQQYA
jgi:hypothetical protein